jgi:hypothetical protein
MTGYTKLFSSITDSTVWREPDRTRLVWITMLAMADADGYVAASVPGLADRARVPLEDCLKALEAFRQPDEWSRTREYEGRRIMDVDGGWQLLNHGKYRAIQDAEHRREQARLGMQRLRADRKAAQTGAPPPPSPAPAPASVKTVSTVSTVNPVNTGEQQFTQAEAEAEAATEAKAGEKIKKPTPSPWLTIDDLTASGLTAETAQGFLDHRRAKKAKLTALAWKGFRAEVEKATGWTLEAACLKAIARNWTGFEASWVAESPRPGGAHVNRQAALEASNRAVGEAWLAKQGHSSEGGIHDAA